MQIPQSSLATSPILQCHVVVLHSTFNSVCMSLSKSVGVVVVSWVQRLFHLLILLALILFVMHLTQFKPATLIYCSGWMLWYLPTSSIPTLSIPTSSIPIWSTSHFVNSHLVNVDKAGIDKMGIDKMGIDEVGKLTKWELMKYTLEKYDAI